MGRKRKKRVMKMTEEDYNNYIMSLKDESPIPNIKPQENSDK